MILAKISVFIVFHNFFNRIILSSFDEKKIFDYTNSNIMLVNCQTEKYKKIIIVYVSEKEKTSRTAVQDVVSKKFR